MDAAKASVKKFIGRDGKHDTTIDESVAPAVQNETVNRTQHEQSTTAVDREVHQDHYHTTEQPVQDREVLSEQHHHNLLPTQEKSYEHDDADKVQQRLRAEQSQYKDTSTRVEGEHTQSAAPTVAGERVHHHVHENVQPVVHKQTIEPHVVHTTQPIHEVHHNAAQHHSATTLPPVSMDEFKKQGGSLAGRESRHDEVAGCPPTQFHPHGTEGHKPHTHNGLDSTPDDRTSDVHGRGSGVSSAGSGHNGSSKYDSAPSTNSTGTSDHRHPEPASYGNDMHTGGSATTAHHKPSFMDKLNPKKDADGDGKPGFMK